MNTSTNKELTDLFESLKLEKSEFRYHQRIVIEYFARYPVRGILIYHKMGAGKSLLAAALCERLIAAKFSVIFLSSKTLHDNFRQTLEKLSAITKKDFDLSKYAFIALNASNMIQQVSREVNKLESLINKSKSRINLSGRVIVVDEAHNFFNSITNGSENAIELYRAIIDSNCKVLFLTGSPITNDPFESAVCFNMLAGSALFPEDYSEFNEYFILEKEIEGVKIRRIKNRSRYANRVFGLVSYYGADDAAFKKLLPHEEKLIVVLCEMSAHQYNQYTDVRKIEQDVERLDRPPKIKALVKSKGLGSSYRVMSRQICNFCYPKSAQKSEHDTKGRLIHKGVFELLETADLVKNIAEYSPKCVELIKNIEKIKGTQLIYSQFLAYGLKIIEKLLVAKKISCAVITGEIDKEIVSEIIKKVNSPENTNGEIIRVILVSSTASEGVDFRNIRAIHIFESYWHWSRIAQVIGRGVRLASHTDLPEKDRTVQPYLYLATQKTKNKEPTSDEYLFFKAKRNQSLIESFLSAIKSAAIDCQVHNYKNCRSCAPTGKPLYLSSIAADLQMPDPCELNEIEVEANLHTINGIVYAVYEKNDETFIARQDGDQFIPLVEPEKSAILALI